MMIFAGRPGWGISWYINNTLIPEIVVERGRTYTFLVYGGDVPANAANYHPFYITDSENGGRLLNTPQQRMVCYCHYVIALQIADIINLYSSIGLSDSYTIATVDTQVITLFLPSFCFSYNCRVKVYSLVLTATTKRLQVYKLNIMWAGS